jgi:F-type H+-transporting ATPase subunit delta
MRSEIWGYLSAVCEIESGNLTRIKSEINGFIETVKGSAELNYILGDATIPVNIKLAVLNDLLIGKALGSTLRFISYAIENETPDELLSCFDEIEIRLRSMIEETDLIIEPFCSRQSARKRLIGYVDAYCQSQDVPGILEDIEDEVFRIARSIESSVDLVSALSDVSVSEAKRLELLSELIKNKVRNETYRISTYPLRSGRLRDLISSLDLAVSRISFHRGRRIADVRSAVELNRDEIDQLQSKLSAIVNENVEVRCSVDRGLIGGLRVKLGNLLIDGSIKHHLQELEAQIIEGSIS